MKEDFVSAMIRETTRDPRVMLITGDLGFGALEPYEERFPSNYLNVGVSEQNMIGVAAGLAKSGRLPFVYSIANFPTFRCLEQIRIDVCYHQLPVNIVSVGAGLSYGTLGYTHHAIEDISVMRSLPGMRIISPSNSVDVADSVKLMVESPGPSYIRLAKGGPSSKVYATAGVLEPFRMLKRGRGVLVLTTGEISSEIAEWANESEGHFGQAGVASIQMIKPMNLDDLLEDYSAIVTVEEHSITGGLGSAVLEFMRDKGIVRPILGLGLSDSVSHEVGSQLHLRTLAGIDAKKLQVLISNFAEKCGLNVNN